MDAQLRDEIKAMITVAIHQFYGELVKRKKIAADPVPPAPATLPVSDCNQSEQLPDLIVEQATRGNLLLYLDCLMEGTSNDEIRQLAKIVRVLVLLPPS